MPVSFTTTAYDVTEGANRPTWGCGFTRSLETLAAGSPELEIDSRIAPEAGTLVITKKRARAFPGTYLQQFLTINRIDTVIVTGVTAAGCVRHTVEEAIAEGFRPIVVREAGNPHLVPTTGADWRTTHQPQSPRAVIHKVAAAAVAVTLVEWFDFASTGSSPRPSRAHLPRRQLDGVCKPSRSYGWLLSASGGRGFFGPLGDRIGRQSVLAITVLLMSGATAAPPRADLCLRLPRDAAATTIATKQHCVSESSLVREAEPGTTLAGRSRDR